MDYNKISKEVLENVGGKDNIISAAHCVTRLRLVLKDTSKYDKVALENIEGAKGVFFNSGQLQVIFGTGLVDQVYAAFVEEADIKESSLEDVKTEGRKSTGKLQEMFKAFSDIFVALIPGIVGCAMILGFRAILITSGLFGLEATLADTYKWASDLSAFLNVIATGLKFLPVFIMYSATKRFGGNPVLGIIIGLVLVHPELGNRFDYLQGNLTDITYWNFFGINIPEVAFQGGVFPAILTSLFLAKFEKFLTKRVPQILSFILVPTLTIIVSAAALFLVFGPLGDVIATGLGYVIELLYMKSGVFGAFIFAAVLQPLVITGTHHAIGSIEAQLIASTGFNYIQPLWAVSITAQGAACVGMFLLAKKKSKRREIAISSFVPTLVGVSEPAIFAVNIKDSIIPFACAVVGAGFGGIYMKILAVKALGFGLTGIPGVTIVNPPVMIHYIIGNLITFGVTILLLLIYNKFKRVPGSHE
ncbi:PTS transporter subunit EIIC [Clostridium vincentii]|uniref:PTS system trehalose-specific EIIBC component n=1 Tax=Clostridium vincentii TaxID=52704 RepID=A0A2T0BEG8_9CLOT|nr:PTS transporter subunit EIIC [Clostridium vincentii]PRR82296.1 PTS system trehalose-specific EIIBC component [Clostridium vincentii]